MKRLAVLASLSLLMGMPIFASEDPCAQDIQKFCSNVEKGEGRIVHCLREHRDELSPGCRKKGDEMKARFKNFQEVCKDDIKKLCGDAKPGQGRIMRCLKEKESQASPACQNLLKQAGKNAK